MRIEMGNTSAKGSECVIREKGKEGKWEYEKEIKEVTKSLF